MSAFSDIDIRWHQLFQEETTKPTSKDKERRKLFHL